MQGKQLFVAIYATFGVGFATAAVTPADIANARALGNGQETWISGASAPTYSIYKGWSAGCDANSEALFTSSAIAGKPGTTGSLNAYACTRSGKVSVAYHSVEHGSISAYTPHLPANQQPQSLRRLRAINNTACTSSGMWGHIPVYTSCAIVTGVNAADNGPLKPAGGFSEATAFVFGLDVSLLGQEVDTSLVQVYGVAVSKNLYRALQVAQGKYVSTADAESNDLAYHPSNAPSLYRPEIVSLIASGSGYQIDWSPLLGNPGVGKSVNVIRQTASSGTKVVADSHFLYTTCATGSAGGLYPATVADSTNTYHLHELASDDAIKAKFTSEANAGNFAIGLMAATHDWRTEPASRNGYRFVTLNGAHPEGEGDVQFARKSAINGHNEFMSEVRGFIADTANPFGVAVIQDIIAKMGSVASCSQVQRGFYLNPMSYLDSVGGAPTGGECSIGQNIGRGTTFGNNCSPIQLFY